MTTEIMKIINPSQIDGMPTMDSRIEINGESLKVTSSEHDANQKCLKIGLENGVVVTFQFPNDFEPSKLTHAKTNPFSPPRAGFVGEMNYWQECMSDILDEAGIFPSGSQLDLIVKGVEGAHETYGQNHGHEAIPDPRDLELKKMENDLKRERSLEYCQECRGSGRIRTQGPHHGSDSDCWKCHGAGKVTH